MHTPFAPLSLLVSLLLAVHLSLVLLACGTPPQAQTPPPDARSAAAAAVLVACRVPTTDATLRQACAQLEQRAQQVQAQADASAAVAATHVPPPPAGVPLRHAQTAPIPAGPRP